MKVHLIIIITSFVNLVLLLLGMVFIGLPAIADAQEPELQHNVSAQAAIGTAFTYQGQLKKGNSPITDTCQIAFCLYDAGDNGNPVGSAITKTVSITDGLFTTSLDFGNVFTGDARWLGIAVKCAGDGSFNSLTPRQALTPAPYAIYAQNVSLHSHNSLDAADGDPQQALFVDNEGQVGIGITTPDAWEALHLNLGNVFMTSPNEQEIRMRRTGLSTYPNAQFQLGRIAIAGDGSPAFRVLYSDDNTTEKSVFEFDDKGIVASVKSDVGSHFEGFIGGDSEPLFRLNSYPAMQLELGPGGSTLTDVAVRRATTATLIFITGDTTQKDVDERVRIDPDGQVGIGTSAPQSKLQVNGYIQLDTVSSVPPAADCDAASEEGRMKFDSTSDVLYICSGLSGWIAK